MAETKLNIATLGTREEVIEVTGAVAITGAAGALGQQAVTFEKAYVNAPKVLAVVGESLDLVKVKLSACSISTTGLTLGIWRNALADLANGTYTVKARIIGWRAS